jgi:hypothetical protein
VLFALVACADYVSLNSLRSWAKPTFAANGELLDGGESLSGGLTEYYQDLIYVSAATLVCSTYSDWAWLIILILPTVATYLIVSKLVIPYMRTVKAQEERGQAAETKEEKRRRERQERRASKKFR